MLHDEERRKYKTGDVLSDGHCHASIPLILCDLGRDDNLPGCFGAVLGALEAEDLRLWFILIFTRKKNALARIDHVLEAFCLSRTFFGVSKKRLFMIVFMQDPVGSNFVHTRTRYHWYSVFRRSEQCFKSVVNWGLTRKTTGDTTPSC